MSSLTIRNHTFTWGSQTYVMGILNATPDSFSGDGLVGREAEGLDTLRYSTGDDWWVHAAIEQGRRFVAEGAHILDVGGESTRPGSQPVDAAEELRRVLPVIAGLAAIVDVPISIDTSKAAVAEAALAAGASIVNDVWGLRLDPPIAQVAAQAGAPVILMHNRSQREHVTIDPALGGRYIGTAYADLLGDIAAELQISMDLARRAGIPDAHIVLDPGIGFGKTVAQNLELLDRLGELRGLGYPILAGPSRKSFIGYTLDLPPDQRVEGTAAAVAIAIARGADIVRVHDVQAMARVARMTDAIVRRGIPQRMGNSGWGTTDGEQRMRNNYTAVVTGSTSGIGRAIALALAAEGVDVLVHGRNAEAAAAIAAGILALGSRAPIVLADLADPVQIDHLVDEAWAALGRVDLWINNAGADVLTGGALHLPFAERLQRLLDVDLRGALLCSHLVGERMLARGGGQIINVGWDQALNGGVGTESGQLFAAAKAGVIGFSKALARGLAPTVRVNVIAPGWIETAWGETVNRELYERLRRQTPLQRWGTPDDVAAAVLYLASPAASFLTGQVLMVNGGVVM